MKILVTGASGRLGIDLVEGLMARGHEVWGVDPQAWQGGSRPHRFEVSDLRDRSAAYRAVEGAEVVIHTGEASHILKGLPLSTTFQFNTIVTSHLFEACADLGVSRVLYTSSCQVYGMCFPGGRISRVPPRQLPFDETHPVQPDNVYAASKVAGEMFAYQVHLRTGIPMAMFRLPVIYRAQPGRPAPIQRPLTSGAGPVCGFGTFIHHLDAVGVLALAAESVRPGYEIYHTTADHLLMECSLQAYLAAFFSDYPPLPADWPGDRSPMLSDKAKAHFRWAPRVNRVSDLPPVCA